jgi:hypothetical protein
MYRHSIIRLLHWTYKHYHYVMLGLLRMLRLFRIHAQPWTASCVHCVMWTMQEAIWRDYWLTFIDMWMDKHTQNKEMNWTEPRILFYVLPAASSSGYTGLHFSMSCWNKIINDLAKILTKYERMPGKKNLMFPPRYCANCVSTTLTVLILHNVESVYFFHSNPVYCADQITWYILDAYSCGRHGPVTAWFRSAWPGNVTPVLKTSTLLGIGVHCLS